MNDSRLGRPADRQEAVVQELRDLIVGGTLPPGSRLPTRLEIEQQFGVGSGTVQRALDRLKQDGFVQTSGRNGTFVVEEPPHLTRYAVVFPHLPQAPGWVRFWTALASEAMEMERAEGRSLPVYYGVDGHRDSPDFMRLVDEVQKHRVAGLIFACKPSPLLNTPLLDEPNVPRVVISANTMLSLPGINLDGDSFWIKALDYLQARGCRRIAFLAPSGHETKQAQIKIWLQERAMTTQPWWWQFVHQSMPQAALNVAHLLMQSGQKERPDGIVISDDNCVEHATVGIVAAGVRVPDDVEVVAHCNFPHPTPAAVPVRRLGYNSRQVFRACIESIDRQRQGESVPVMVSIPALFEDELSEV